MTIHSLQHFRTPTLAPKHSKSKAPFVVSVTSGKGGVGKTLTTVNLAVAARKMGKSVLIFDGDLGLANVDVVLGLNARYNIRDVLDDHAQLKDIILEGPLGVHVVPSGSGVAKLSHLTPVQRLQLSEKLDLLDDCYDVIIIDTGAGISDNVLHFNAVANRILVVTTPEPHSMTDAYALIKVMHEEYRKKSFDIVVNQTRSDEEGLKVFGRIAEVAGRFLSVNVEYAGRVPMDGQVQRNVMLRRAASDSSCMTLAGQAWNEIALRIFSENCTPTHSDSKGVWKHLFNPARPLEASSIQTRI